jgi:hypothetical protein
VSTVIPIAVAIFSNSARLTRARPFSTSLTYLPVRLIAEASCVWVIPARNR